MQIYIKVNPQSTHVRNTCNQRKTHNQRIVETKPKMRTKTRLEYIIRNKKDCAHICLRNFSWH